MVTRSAAAAGAILPKRGREPHPRKCKMSRGASNTVTGRPAKRRRKHQEPFIPDESNTIDLSGMSIADTLSLPSKTFREFQKEDVFWVKTKWGLVKFRPAPNEKGNIKIHIGEALVRDYPYSDGHLMKYKDILSNVFNDETKIKEIARDIIDGTSNYLEAGNQTRAVSLLVALQVISERERRHIPVKNRFMNTLKEIAENGCEEGCSPQSLFEEICPWIREKGVKIACVEHRKEIDAGSAKDFHSERKPDERRATEATTDERDKLSRQNPHSINSVQKVLPFCEGMYTRSQSQRQRDVALVGEDISLGKDM